MKKHLWGGLLIILIGILLLFVRSDRQTLGLTPTPGVSHSISLHSQDTYQFTFRSNLALISRFGLYLSPIGGAVPAGDITLDIRRGNELIGSTILPSGFIDNENASFWRFSQPLPNKGHETLTASIHIPENLSGKIAVKTRTPDQTFNAHDTQLTINGSAQSEPLAYVVYTQYMPPLPAQVGGLLILAGISLIVSFSTHKSLLVIGAALLLAIIANLPAVALGGLPWLIVITQGIAWYGMYVYMRSQGVSAPSATLAASVFAFTSWFALQLDAGRSWYMAVSMVPILLVLQKKYVLGTQQRIMGGILCAGFIGILFFTPFSIPQELPVAPASLRDIFLDPNQAATAVKVAGGVSWTHFGSYIGSILLVLACVGMLHRRPPWKKGVIALALLSIMQIPWIYTTPFFEAMHFSPAHVSILVTLLISMVAGQGLERLRSFLGKHDMIVKILCWALVVIVILDLWQVAAPILEYPYL